MSAELCGAFYERPDGTRIGCTFLKGHPNFMERCSWFAVQKQDEADAEKIDYTPTAIQALLDAMAEGTLDEYVEAILAVGHMRKRSKRGVRHEWRLEKPDAQ